MTPRTFAISASHSDRLWHARHARLCIAFTLVLLAASACAVRLDDEPSAVQPDFTLQAAHELCVSQPPEGVVRGGAFSLPFSQGTLLVFAETVQDESRFLGSSSATVEADPCAGLGEVREEDGDLAELIPLTPGELEPRPDGASIRLWPKGGYVHDDVGYVFYEKVLFRGYFDTTVLGIGVARLRYGQPAERLDIDAYSHEPTLLWLGAEGWGRSAVVTADGTAYVYGCLKRGPWDEVCRVARVPASNPAALEAYTYWSGERWSEHSQDADAILRDSQSTSVTYRPELGGFVAVQPGFLDNRVLARVARQPQGPFGDPVQLYAGTAPESFWISDVRQHRLRGPRGGFLTSYQTNPAGGVVGMRWVEVVAE